MDAATRSRAMSQEKRAAVHEDHEEEARLPVPGRRGADAAQCAARHCCSVTPQEIVRLVAGGIEISCR